MRKLVEGKENILVRLNARRRLWRENLTGRTIKPKEKNCGGEGV